MLLKYDVKIVYVFGKDQRKIKYPSRAIWNGDKHCGLYEQPRPVSIEPTDWLVSNSHWDTKKAILFTAQRQTQTS